MKTEKLEKKKKYEEASQEIILIEKCDVVATSDSSLDPGGNYDDKAWT